jgi:hypothetical protein
MINQCIFGLKLERGGWWFNFSSQFASKKKAFHWCEIVISRCAPSEKNSAGHRNYLFSGRRRQQANKFQRGNPSGALHSLCKVSCNKIYYPAASNFKQRVGWPRNKTQETHKSGPAGRTCRWFCESFCAGAPRVAFRCYWLPRDLFTANSTFSFICRRALSLSRSLYFFLFSQIFRPAAAYICNRIACCKIGIIPQCNPPVAIFTFCIRPLWKSRSALRTLYLLHQIPAARCFHFLRFSAFPQVDSTAATAIGEWMNAALIIETGENRLLH